MGQYYHTIFLDTANSRIRAWMDAWSYNNGHKLMEHSYIGNNYMAAVEWLLSPLGFFYKTSIVWAGDYAEPEVASDSEEEDERQEKENLYHRADRADHADRQFCGIPSSIFNAADWPYLVNHTKKEYVVKPTARGSVHPLSILTSEGNGQGGGDYRGRDEHLAGRWARDIISVEKTTPKDYSEFDVDFEED
jgi:hypothetical protein